jgi:hypothetical protein
VVIDTLYYPPDLNPGLYHKKTSETMARQQLDKAKSRKSVPGSEVVEIPNQGTTYGVIACTGTFTLTATAYPCPALSKSTTLDRIAELQLPIKAVLAEGSSQRYSIKPNAQQEMLPNFPSPRWPDPTICLLGIIHLVFKILWITCVSRLDDSRHIVLFF